MSTFPQLTELTAAPEDADEFLIRDVSGGTDKRMRFDAFSALFGQGDTQPPTNNDIRDYYKIGFQPSVLPTISSNFARNNHELYEPFGNEPKSLLDIWTCTRASTATYVDPTGIIREAAADTPRVTYDPETGESLGLLVEEQRTNLLTYSEEFDNSDWSKNNATATADVEVAPDGTTTADKLVEDTSDSNHGINQAATVNSTTLTFTVFAKAAENNFVQLVSSIDGALGRVNFDLTSEDINYGGDATGDFERYGDGWYRIVFSAPCTSGTSYTMQVRTTDTLQSSPAGYQGDGTSGIYIWGAQLEEGPSPTSYIPTTSAQVTREADEVERALGDGELTDREWTVFVDFMTYTPETENDGILIAGNNYRFLHVFQNQTAFRADDGSVVTKVADRVIGSRTKIALAYDGSNLYSAQDGFEYLSPDPADFSGISDLLIGERAENVIEGNTVFYSIETIPRALTESELEELTK